MRYLWAIAAALILVYGYAYVNNKDRSMELRRVGHKLAKTKTQMNALATHLKTFKSKHGRYPTNDEGLLALSGLIKQSKADDYVIRIIRVTPSGVLSIWGEPYIYENRIGKPASAFAGSGVDTDPQRKYSVKVDDGVYIWSATAKQQAEDLAHWLPLIKYAYALIWILAGACIVGFFVACQRRIDPTDSKYDKIGAYGRSALGALATTFLTWVILLPSTVATCYETRIQRPRTPEITDNYIAIMRKYRDNGAISKKAFDKLLKALKEDEKAVEYYR